MENRRSIKNWVILIAVVFVYSAAVSAQSLIDPSRRIDWSGAGIIGGIPKRTTICATLSPGVTTDQINTAIASCPANQVVFLNPGTYNLGSAANTVANNNGVTIAKSGVTVRGSGPDKTILKFTNGIVDNRVQIGTFRTNSPKPSVTAVNWVGGYAKGTTQITLASALPASQVGGMICLDQLYDGVNVRLQGASGNPSPSWLSRNGNRLLQQCVLATAVSGNTVTISPGLYSPYWNALPNLNPQAWWIPKSSQVFNSGVEDLAVDPGNSGGENNFEISGAIGSWMKNVELKNIPRRALVVEYSMNTEIRDSYIHHGSTYCTDGGAVEIGRAAVSDTLFENNIFTDVAAALYNEAESGNVVGYNYGVNFPYCSAGWLAETINTHGAHPTMTLFEGNQITQFVADDVYDPTSHITIFRNRFTGYDVDTKDGPKDGGTYAISLVRWSDYFSVIGNVLGTSGVSNIYNDLLSGSGGGGSVYNFAYYNGFPTGLIRGGNYDTKTNSVIWSNNVPSGDTSTYLPQQALPASLYKLSKPTWWNSPLLTNPNLPWPAIGPDVTGGNGPGGNSYDIPAKQCFDKLQLATGGAYNGNNCYSESTPGPDTTPPTLSNGQPSGTLSSGTTSTTMSVATNENANCKYSTTAGVGYSSMTNTFTTTGGTTHSILLTGLANGQTYRRYVRCQDASGNANANDFIVSFSVANTAYDYSLSNGGGKTITQGQSISNTITTTLSSGTAQAVSFSSSGFPSGTTSSFSSVSCLPTCTTTITINTINSTPTGNYTINVNGIGGTLTRATNFRLTVNPIITNSCFWDFFPRDIPDGKVTLGDVLVVVGDFGKTPASPGFNSRMDFNYNNQIDLFDVLSVVANFGKC